jgi:hypothetical protein
MHTLTLDLDSSATVSAVGVVGVADKDFAIAAAAS